MSSPLTGILLRACRMTSQLTPTALGQVKVHRACSRAVLRMARPMGEEDVADTFATAAPDSRRVGFNTVEIDGVHGQLVDRPHCSRRCFGDRGFTEPGGENGLSVAGWAKKVTGAPDISIVTVGLNNEYFGTYNGERFEGASLKQLNDRMDREELDRSPSVEPFRYQRQQEERLRGRHRDGMKTAIPPQLARRVQAATRLMRQSVEAFILNSQQCNYKQPKGRTS